MKHIDLHLLMLPVLCVGMMLCVGIYTSTLGIGGNTACPSHGTPIIQSPKSNANGNIRFASSLSKTRNPKSRDETNIDSLKYSSWFSIITKKIEAEEYNIVFDKKGKHYTSPNRKQNLLFTYYSNGFSVKPLVTKIPLFNVADWRILEGVSNEKNTPNEPPQEKYKCVDDWNIRMTLEGYGRDSSIVPFLGTTLTVNERNASNSDGSLSVHYNNTEKGMRQDFVLATRPSGTGNLTLLLHIETKLRPNAGGDGIAFSNDSNRVEMYYNRMLIKDRKGKKLHGEMMKKGPDEVAICIHDEEAVYPLIIDPLSNTADWTQTGENNNDWFGWSVATAGDVNGDGYGDVVVGAARYSSYKGKVYVYYGSSTGLSTTASWTQTGENTGDWFGNSVATAGDVNGDGYSDVIVGASGYSSATGKAYVYYGSSTGLSATSSWTETGENVNDNFGVSVATAGDVNGDGYSDVIVGACGYSSWAGKAYVYQGGSTGLSATASWIQSGENSGDRFGNSVATAGDVNGDGYNDVIVGACGYSSYKGKAYVYCGSSTGLSTTPSWTQTGENSNDDFGLSLATAGDVNGDGYSDIVVGAYYYSSGTGKAYVYYGSSTGLSATASWTKAGESVGDYFGHSVTTTGDVNGDGYSDVMVGAANYSSGTGKAYVYYGSSTGLSTTASWTQTGENAGDLFGHFVATAGDVNGDGYSDVIIGAPCYSSQSGKAYVYYGSSAGLSTTASWTKTGENAYDSFGFSVAMAGDVNGDGYSDVIVGASNYSSATGKAYVYYGSSTGLSTTPAWTKTGENVSDNFGVSVATAGDVNGDGYSDVIVGANFYSSQSGKAYVYYGSSTGLSTTASWTKTGENTGDRVGWSVATAGDVNGDGYSDVIVGAYGYSSWAGKAYVYYGSSTGLCTAASWTQTGENTNNYFGISVAAAGDVNGDGYSDVIVGASYYGSDTGKAYVYYGSSTGLSTTAAWTKTGENRNDDFGFSVATAGDVNGDGYSDIIVGARYYPSGTCSGKAYVYCGSSTGLPTTASWTKTGENTFDYFGISVAAAGDVNGDGYSDVVVGASCYSSGTGKAYVYYGSSTGLSTTAAWTKTGENVNDGFGVSVATAGDVNGDGYSDVIVGAFGNSSSSGKAYVYDGNSAGLKDYVQQYQPSSSTVLGPNGNTSITGSIRLSGYGRSPLGRAKGKLVYEYRAVGNPFSGQYSTSSTGSQSSFTDLGTAGLLLNIDVSSIPANTAYNWRARTKYDLAGNPFQVFGPWRYYASYQPLAFGNFKPLGAGCALPVQAIDFIAKADVGSVTLSWKTLSEVNNAGFNVLREDPSAISYVVIADYRNDADLRGLGTSSTGRSYHFIDKTVRSGATYRYKIQDVSSNSMTKDLVTLSVKVDVPKSYALYQNYANPFNPSTTIQFDLKQASTVVLELYNSLGQKVDELSCGVMEPGRCHETLNLGRFASGTYYYRISAISNNGEKFVAVKKLVLLK